MGQSIDEEMVSVCIPVFNGVKFLSDCLSSIIQQNYKHIEIILVDDCSSDSSTRIANSFAAKDKRVQVYVNDRNMGLVNNWNRCIEIASGEWVKFMFQDDVFLSKNALSSMLRAANEKDVRMVFSKRKILYHGEVAPGVRKFYDRNVEVIQEIFGATGISQSHMFLERIDENFTYNVIGEPSAVLLHRTVFDSYGTFHAGFIQLCDWEYWCRVALHEPIGYVDTELVGFRVHEDAMSARNRKKYRFQLEKLGLMHEMAFKKHFEGVSVFLKERGRNLMQELRNLARDTRWSLWRYGTQEDRKEWNRFVEAFPGIKALSRVSASFVAKRILSKIKRKAFKIGKSGSYAK